MQIKSTSPQLEWSLPKRQKISNAGVYVEKWELLHAAGGKVR